VRHPIHDETTACEWLEHRTASVGKPTNCIFAIDVRGRAVGEVSLSRIDPFHRKAWLSYWVAADMRGRGLASRAAASLVAYGFDELNLERVELGHRVDNPASGVVAARAGFTQEGHERGKLRYDGERFDTLSYGRLCTDAAPTIELVTIVAEPVVRA
ncbi:MAG: hypothetical protein JWN41_65, partial [Thermoleophilia bacterium]|nr:hypothetical protein [Thermoleophilia bacterium]